MKLCILDFDSRLRHIYNLFCRIPKAQGLVVSIKQRNQKNDPNRYKYARLIPVGIILLISLLFFRSANQQNYAHFRAFYKDVLADTENTHRGSEKLLSVVAVSFAKIADRCHTNKTREGTTMKWFKAKPASGTYSGIGGIIFNYGVNQLPSDILTANTKTEFVDAKWNLGDRICSEQRHLRPHEMSRSVNRV